MNALTLTPVDGEPRVDSRFIAKQLGVEHESARKQIRDYQADFEQLGLLRFEIAAVEREGGRGTKFEKFALLNEDQSYLLLTYSRNTPQARALKIRTCYRNLNRKRNHDRQRRQPGARPATGDSCGYC